MRAALRTLIDAAPFAGTVLIGRERDVTSLRQRLLLPGAESPAGFAACGRIVCSCFDVAEADVRQALEGATDGADAALRRVQKVLRCGTNCGSCLPELRRLAGDNRRSEVDEQAA